MQDFHHASLAAIQLPPCLAEDQDVILVTQVANIHVIKCIIQRFQVNATEKL